MVGLPYLVRTVLGLNAKYYGTAESALAIATIIGSIAAGLMAENFKIHRLAILLASLGIFLIPTSIVYPFPIHPLIKYIVTIFSFGGMQAAISIFSIFAVSLIQQRTPEHFLGKIMAYTSALTLCVQPIGQIVYGFLLDQFHNMVSLVFLPTGIIVCAIGLFSTKFFQTMEQEQHNI